jgi:putative colanic acid biosynthesis acetyltransferase WcaF
MGDFVDCYSVDKIELGQCAIVSQYSYLCAASHPLDDMGTLIHAPIRIEANAWVAADAFVAMGVTVGEGAVVGARASVFKNVEPWTVVAGNPARFMRHRPKPVNGVKEGGDQANA